MDATTSPSPSARLLRFSRAERWVHRSIAVLMVALIATGAALYFPDISVLVGNRPLISDIHWIAGFALPVPLILALASKAFRKDSDELNRFTSSDWKWLRSPDRRSGRIPIGKFNAGQKLNAAFSLGSIIIMLATGSIMFFSSLFPDDIRTGATFVHDWLTLLIVVVVAGHTYMAMKDSEARVGMRTGYVSQQWAAREHDQWAKQAHNADV
jgi:formate dehydrogenase subunit gamma